MALALIGGGVGQSTRLGRTAAELRLERADYERVVHELSTAQPGVEREIAQARAAWPEIAKGLRSSPSMTLRMDTAAASRQAGRLARPAFLASNERLTGPASGLAALYEDFARLAEQGWRLTDATLDSIASGRPSEARFARENSSLYIYAIYDGHYDLSLLGKSIRDGYERLGGARFFKAKLPQAEIDRLAAAYSIPAVRLTPHPAASIDLP